MAVTVPYQPQNLVCEQADGNILLTWGASLSATGYQIQRSTDGINFTNLATVAQVTQYEDSLPGVGIQYYYQVAGTNTSGTGPYSSIASMIAAPPSEMSLYELRLRAQQTADRVASDFVTTSEWNAFLRLAQYELYDLLITSYEDYFATQQAFITTNGSQQYYPLPDGVTNYPGGTYNAQSAFTFTVSSANASINSVYLNNTYQFTVGSTITGGTTLTATGTGTPSPNGILTKVSGNGDSQITYSQYSVSLAGQPNPAFYKMVGVDLAVNTSMVNPAWVTLKKFNFIDRNKYVYPNSTSVIYGVYNQAYRIMGDQIDFIPVPAGNQTIRLWYIPKLKGLLKDTDLTTVGYSGWLRYSIVRGAIYALSKEEGSDVSQLNAELVFLKTRIEQAAQNRDAGIPDCISETRRDGIYGGNGWGGGGNNAGWGFALLFPVFIQNYQTNILSSDTILFCQHSLVFVSLFMLFANASNFFPSKLRVIVAFARKRLSKIFQIKNLSPFCSSISGVIERSPDK